MIVADFPPYDIPGGMAFDGVYETIPEPEDVPALPFDGEELEEAA